jgi:hypothetical protein
VRIVNYKRILFDNVCKFLPAHSLPIRNLYSTKYCDFLYTDVELLPYSMDYTKNYQMEQKLRLDIAKLLYVLKLDLSFGPL